MRRILVAVVTAALAVPAMASPAPEPTPADLLVEKLAAASYADREAAAHGLLRLGAAALPALDRALATGSDPEALARAARIADQIRRAETNARYLAAPPVSFEFDRVPLAAALADLKAKTGLPLEFAPDGVANPLRPVSAKADALPPWEALEQFCRASGLREVFRPDVSDIGPRTDRGVVVRQGVWNSNYLAETPRPSAGNTPVVLADGRADSPPGERSTAVRVVALPPGFSGNRVVRGAGEVVLHLDVTPLPGLTWEETTAVLIARAEDDAGRPVWQSFRPDESTAAVHALGEQVFIGGGVVVGNAIMFDDLNVLRQAARPNPRLIPMKLRTGDRAISSLRFVEGVVLGEIGLANQTLIEVSDLPRSVGRTFAGPGDAKLTVLAYEPVGESGDVVVRLRVEGPNLFVLNRLAGRNRAALLNAAPIMPGEGVALAAGLGQAKFLDAGGRPIRPPVPTSSSLSDDGFRQVQETDLTFPKSRHTGPPAKLQVVGNKGVTVEVPFRLTDVPLP